MSKPDWKGYILKFYWTDGYYGIEEVIDLQRSTALLEGFERVRLTPEYERDYQFTILWNKFNFKNVVFEEVL